MIDRKKPPLPHRLPQGGQRRIRGKRAGKIMFQQRFIRQRRLFAGGFINAVCQLQQIRTAFLPQLRQHRRQICARQIGLVDKKEDRNAQPAQQRPDRQAMRLQAFSRADHQHSAIQCRQYPLHLRRKIDMARRIDQKKAPSLPAKIRLAGKYRDAAPLLDLMRI